MFNDLFGENSSRNVLGLTDELKVIYVNNLFKNTSTSKLIVTNTLYEANKFYNIFSKYNDNCFLFPMDDFLTSEALAISPELKATRLETLNHVVNNNVIVVTNLMGYLRYLPPKKIFLNKKIILRVKDNYNINKLSELLFNLGYSKETIVNKTGEMAIRGFVVDIFPINAINPIRIEFWGDEIDSIREFNIDNQLTIKKLDEIVIGPNTEFLTDCNIDNFLLKQKDLVNYGNVVNIKDYFQEVDVIYINYDEIMSSYNMLLEEMCEYSISNEININTKYMHDLYELKVINPYYLSSLDNFTDNVDNTINYNSSDIESFSGSLDDTKNRLFNYLKKYKVIICLSDRYKVNKMLETFNNDLFIFTDDNNIIKDKINLIIKDISEGFIIKDYVVISESEIFNKKNISRKYKTNFKLGTKIRDIAKLNIGDYIVHNTYGIGKYLGIKAIDKNGLKKDYLWVEYKDEDKLYIPVEKIDLISKYSSNEGATPRLNKLGGTDWEKTKLRTKSKIEDIALELLKLYAEREASVGFKFLEDDINQLEFEKEFKYNETTDQIKVIDEIKRDMESGHPMDRLLCGDVGYGKTEVAFRAMFKAVLSGKQVALLCPTTILSSQHFNNAIERFKSFPVNICLINRFVSSRVLKKNLSEIKEGKVDIVIGTHRILSDDVVFKDLGLLVIDEEQRFGVKHKEKIKQYKNNVDVLTLSATPIPRTLQMSMAGIRSLSLIETPPINRYPVQTYVLAENKQIIKDAIYKELSRNGQIFLLFNHIDEMDSKKKEIEQLVPDARIVCAHGKMDKKELEDIMYKFVNYEYDVLISTTIIETGIDIPSANTLIIIDADHFGLSQLYQIRGRVGRSERIAYCYLMYDKRKILSEIAIKRLKVIKDFTELGSGFAIAMRDMAIRGAGDILGSEQAGFVDAVGIELFLKMLNEEIERLKGNIIEEDVASNLPLVDVDTSINDSYVADEELKIEIHKKINTIDSYDSLVNIKKEIEDRFGKMDDSLIIYMYEEWFEKLAYKLGIDSVKQNKNSIEVTLSRNLTDKINGDVLFMEVSSISRMFRFGLKFNRMIITLNTVKLDKHFIYYLIDLMNAINKSL